MLDWRREVFATRQGKVHYSEVRHATTRPVAAARAASVVANKCLADIVTTEDNGNTYRRFLRWKTQGSDAQWHTRRVNLTRRKNLTT
jgi:hypothetical protein